MTLHLVKGLYRHNLKWLSVSKGTYVSVICPSIRTKMAWQDLQRYPWNLKLINNVEEILPFLDLTEFNSDNFHMFFCSIKYTTFFWYVLHAWLDGTVSQINYSHLLVKLMWIGHWHYMHGVGHLKFILKFLYVTCRITKDYLTKIELFHVFFLKIDCFQMPL